MLKPLVSQWDSLQSHAGKDFAAAVKSNFSFVTLTGFYRKSR